MIIGKLTFFEGKMEESVCCLIFNQKKDQILLIKRRDIPVWVLPGGGIEKEESAEDAAIREALEETGLTVLIKRKIAKYLPANRLTKITHSFECTGIQGELTTGPETREIAFFPLDHLPKKLVPFYKTWIKDALINSSEIIESKIQKTSYWTFLLYVISHPLLVLQFLLTRIGIHINRVD